MADELTALRDLIARRYATDSDARRVAREVDLPLERMAFGETSRSRWDAILQEAVKLRRLERLCKLFLKENHEDDEVTGAVTAAAASAFLANSAVALAQLRPRVWNFLGPVVGAAAGVLLCWAISTKAQTTAPIPLQCPSVPAVSDDVRTAPRDLESCLELEHEECVCPKCRLLAKTVATECGKILDARYP